MRYNKGFTLIELMVVMGILGLISALSSPYIVEELNTRRANNAASETQAIVDAARAYRVRNGNWPGNATCSNAISVLKADYLPYLPSSGATNRFNSLYSTSCTTMSFSLDQEAIQDWDGYLINTVASSQIVDSATHRIRTTIGVPGTEAALDGKLSRLASSNAELNRMRTTLLLGGNNITEVGAVDAVTGNFSGNVKGASGTFAGNVTAGSGTFNGLVSAVTGIFSGGVSANTVSANSVSANTGQFASGISAAQGTIWGNLNTSTLTVQQAAAIAGSLAVQGSSQFAGTAVFYDAVVINKVVTEGTGGCGRGYIATDASGKLLSCQNGIWTSNGGGAPEFLSINIKGNSKTIDVTNYPCPAGYIKTGWDTTGQGWRQSDVSPGLYIGANDWAMVFCAKY